MAKCTSETTVTFTLTLSYHEKEFLQNLLQNPHPAHPAGTIEDGSRKRIWEALNRPVESVGCL